MAKGKLNAFMARAIAVQQEQAINALGSSNLAAALGSKIEIKKIPKPSMGKALVRCGPTFCGSLDESSEEASRIHKKSGGKS